MNESPKAVAARAYENATGRDPRRWDWVQYADGVHQDTDDRWILYHVKTRTGFVIRVTEHDGQWLAGKVVEASPEEIAI